MVNFQGELARRFPRERVLEGGRRVVLRPMTSQDEAALADFFRRMPAEDRQVFKDDVTDDRVIQRWCRSLDYGKILPLLAVAENRIVADATLHRSGIRASWHVATVRLSVEPGYRGIGLAKALVRELVEVAPLLGVAYVDAEMLPQQKRAIRLFEELGFVTVGTLPQHVRDVQDRFHDVVLMTHMAMQPERLSPDAELGVEEVDIGDAG